MIEVAILTPDPATAGEGDNWQAGLQRLHKALGAAGIGVTPAPWTAHAEDAAGLQRFDHVLPLLAWGYHLDHARWLAACETWHAAGVPLSNPAKVLAWNSDKRYLASLQAKGVAIPPTTWTHEVSEDLLRQAFDATGADELVVKPSVSGGAWRTRRVPRGGIHEALAGVPSGGEMLIQPYLPTIASDGETSFLFFDGHLSHVVNKRPVPGDFRVQEEFGGRYAVLPDPPAEALALAQQVLEAIGTPLLYARIDMVPDAQGRWLLMEAELIEPDLYLHMDPAQGARFAAALRARSRG